MEGRVLSVRDLTPGDEAAWRDLAARALEPNPLYEPDCVVPAARHQAFGADIGLVVAEQGGTWHACIPIRVVPVWYGLRVRTVSNKVRRSTYIGTPLVDDTAPQQALVAVLRALQDQRRAGGFRVFGIDSLRHEGPVVGHLYAAAAELGLPSFVREDFLRGMVCRHDAADYTTGHRNVAGELRKRRRLAELFDGQLEIVDRSHDPDAPREFVDLEAAGYKIDTVALANTAGDPAYFMEMCERFAAADRLTALVLQGGGKTLAMQFWLRGGPGLFLIKLAYDEEYSRYSPGTALTLESFNFFHDHTDAQWIDSCASPDNLHHLRLYGERTRILTVLFSLGGSATSLMVRSLPALLSARRKVKRLVRRHAESPLSEAPRPS